MNRADHDFLRPWIVCERGNRWTTALRRFLPEMMPTPWVASMSRIERSEASEMLSGQIVASGHGTIVLWEIDCEDFVFSCDCVSRTTVRMPGALQLAAIGGRSEREAMILSELGVAATLRHPEHLLGIRPMIHGYYARGA